MKITICSMGYTGYSAACWRELASREGVELSVFTPETHHAYDAKIIEGLPIQVFKDEEFCSTKFAGQFPKMVSGVSPDVVLIGGWGALAYRKLFTDSALAKVSKYLMIDTMWEWKLKSLLSRFRLHSIVARAKGAIVAGDRGRTFARYIGFRAGQIYISTYGYAADSFADCLPKRIANGGTWPRRFVFVGRYVPIKGIDALLTAYENYRKRHPVDAWELHCYGRGPLADRLARVEGVVDHGFLQPDDLPNALTEAGAFVLPSMKDPWGVALAEAAGAGLPLIASDEVSSSVDLVRHLYNGYLVPAGDATRLEQALEWIHQHYNALLAMGSISKVYAGAYTPKVWADRIQEICTRA